MKIETLHGNEQETSRRTWWFSKCESAARILNSARIIWKPTLIRTSNISLLLPTAVLSTARE